MKLDVYIPAIGQEEILNQCIDFLWYNCGDGPIVTRCFVIDNGSKVPIKAGVKVIRNEENLGMVGSLKQALEHSDADIICYMHSDMFIYEQGWDTQIIQAFEADPKLACLGVVGAVQADANGGRTGTVCAFRDGHLHGTKPTQKITPVCLLDGCCQIFRRSVLETVPWDEFEENGYLFSYDKGITVWLTMASHRVGVIDLDSEHLGGRTSCQTEFNNTLTEKGTTLDAMYRESERKYIERWKSCFPIRVTPDWVVHVGGKR